MTFVFVKETKLEIYVNSLKVQNLSILIPFYSSPFYIQHILRKVVNEFKVSILYVDLPKILCIDIYNFSYSKINYDFFLTTIY